MGDVIAEGGWAAASILHLGEDIARRYYTDGASRDTGTGTPAGTIPSRFPFWLVTALQWLTDTRDPIPSGHGYVHAVALYRTMYMPEDKRPPNAITWTICGASPSASTAMPIS